MQLFYQWGSAAAPAADPENSHEFVTGILLILPMPGKISQKITAETGKSPDKLKSPVIQFFVLIRFFENVSIRSIGLVEGRVETCGKGQARPFSPFFKTSGIIIRVFLYFQGIFI